MFIQSQVETINLHYSIYEFSEDLLRKIEHTKEALQAEIRSQAVQYDHVRISVVGSMVVINVEYRPDKHQSDLDSVNDEVRSHIESVFNK